MQGALSMMSLWWQTSYPLALPPVCRSLSAWLPCWLSSFPKKVLGATADQPHFDPMAPCYCLLSLHSLLRGILTDCSGYLI